MPLWWQIWAKSGGKSLCGGTRVAPILGASLRALKWTAILLLFTCSFANISRAEQSELDCMAEAVYYEARGESLIGQLAVGTVILNRVKGSRYKNTICSVVHDRCAFSYYCDGKPERMANRRARRTAYNIARLILDGATVETVWNATHYHAAYVTPIWSRHMERLGRIGSHIFYREE